MYLFQLDELARKNIDSKVYVVPCDMLPEQITLPFHAIINNSSSQEAGTHWVMLTIDASGTAHYLDSYGMMPRSKDILRFIRLHSKNFVWNEQQLQRVNSRVCGLYCLMGLYFMINQRQSLDQFIENFTKNLFLNDKIIETMYSKLIRK